MMVNDREDGKKQPAEKLTRLTDIMKSLSDKKFTGYIKIKFSSGSVEKVEKFEEILKK